MTGAWEASEAERRQAAQDRLAMLDAVLIAIDRRDELFAAVQLAADDREALQQVMETFGFDEPQAHAALDLQVRRFTPLWRQRVADEREALRAIVTSE